jgi:hypothetical protein
MRGRDVCFARLFAFFSWFWADFCFSKTPLNIREYLILTKMPPPPVALPNKNAR